jgi:hypothetical protein
VVIMFLNLRTVLVNAFFQNLLSPHMKQGIHSISLHRLTSFLPLIAKTGYRKMNSVLECRHLNDGLKQKNICYFHDNRCREKSHVLNNW